MSGPVATNAILHQSEQRHRGALHRHGLAELVRFAHEHGLCCQHLSRSAAHKKAAS